MNANLKLAIALAAGVIIGVAETQDSTSEWREVGAQVTSYTAHQRTIA